MVTRKSRSEIERMRQAVHARIRERVRRDATKQAVNPPAPGAEG